MKKYIILAAVVLIFLPNIADAAGTVTYRYLRWTITERMGGGASIIQVAEFTPLLSGSPVSWPGGTTATNPGGNNPLNEEPPKAVDGTSATKWLDFLYSGFPSIFIIDTGAGNSVTFDGYRWTTANDSADRDPAGWTLEGSTDGSNWYLLDTRSGETITATRFTDTSNYTITAPFPARSASSSQSLRRPPNNLGLVGYWSFNEGAGTVAHDFSGNGNTGTLTNGPTWVNGKLGKAVNLVRSSGHYVVGSAPVTAIPLTISYWIKVSALPSSSDSYVTMWLGDGGANTWRAFYSAVGDDGSVSASIVQNNSFGGPASSAGVISPGQWYHVVAVYNTNAQEIFVNGVSKGTGSSSLVPTGVDSLIVGAENVFPGSFGNVTNGAVDEVRVYRRALGATEIRALYQSGAATLNTSQTQALTSGLVGYWTLDGKDTSWYTNTTNDLSGQGNTARIISLSTTTSSAIGKLGQSYNFNGSTQYLDIANSSSLKPTGPFTMTAWFKTNSTDTNQHYLLASYSQNPNVAGIGIAINVQGSSAHKFGIISGMITGNQYKTAFSTTNVDDGKWHHGVGIWDGSYLYIYVDGVLEDTQSWANAPAYDASNAIRIGNVFQSSSAQYFDGKIDDVRVYNRAFSAAEAKQLYTLGQATLNTSQTQSNTSGLVGYWTFDGKNTNWRTNTTSDLSGQGNTGRMTSMSTTSVPVIGVSGQGFKFDGVDDYVNLGITSFPAIDAPKSISAWAMYAATPSGNQNIFAMNTSGAAVQLGYRSGSGTILAWKDGGTTLVNSGVLPSVGQWHHYVYTYDGSTNRIYVDGVEMASSGTGQQVSSATSATIGNSGGEAFAGSIDDVRLYNRALSASEIKRLYGIGH